MEAKLSIKKIKRQDFAHSHKALRAIVKQLEKLEKKTNVMQKTFEDIRAGDFSYLNDQIELLKIEVSELYQLLEEKNLQKETNKMPRGGLKKKHK